MDLRTFECCLVVEIAGEGCSRHQELFRQRIFWQIVPISGVSYFIWQTTYWGFLDWLSAIHILPIHFFSRKLGGLSQSFPFLGPGALILARPYCKKQWSPMFVWKNLKKKKNHKEGERKWDCPRAEHWRFLDCCRLMDVVAKVFSLTYGVATKGREDVYIGLGLTFIMGDVGLGSVDPTGHLSFWEMKSTSYLPKKERVWVTMLSWE